MFVALLHTANELAYVRRPVKNNKHFLTLLSSIVVESNGAYIASTDNRVHGGH